MPETNINSILNQYDSAISEARKQTTKAQQSATNTEQELTSRFQQTGIAPEITRRERELTSQLFTRGAEKRAQLSEQAPLLSPTERERFVQSDIGVTFDQINSLKDIRKQKSLDLQEVAKQFASSMKSKAIVAEANLDTLKEERSNAWEIYKQKYKEEQDAISTSLARAKLAQSGSGKPKELSLTDIALGINSTDSTEIINAKRAKFSEWREKAAPDYLTTTDPTNPAVMDSYHLWLTDQIVNKDMNVDQDYSRSANERYYKLRDAVSQILDKDPGMTKASIHSQLDSAAKSYGYGRELGSIIDDVLKEKEALNY